MSARIWVVGPEAGGDYAIAAIRKADSPGEVIAEVFCDAAHDPDEAMADAELLAAAPILANALEALLPWVQSTHESELSDGTPCDCDRCEKLDAARAALRAAGRLP